MLFFVYKTTNIKWYLIIGLGLNWFIRDIAGKGKRER
jgi:hypothetical protein